MYKWYMGYAWMRQQGGVEVGLIQSRGHSRLYARRLRGRCLTDLTLGIARWINTDDSYDLLRRREGLCI